MSTVAPAHEARAAAPAKRASTAALAWRQFRFERRMFWRNPSAAFFNFLLPLVLLVLIAAAFGTSRKRLDTLIPGIAGMSVMTTTFIALAYNITFLREQGVLKRMRGTPLPRIAYFGGIVGNAVANAVVQIVIVVVLAKLIYGLGWPRDGLELVVFTLLGVTAFASLGIAYAHVIPNFNAAAAYVNIVFLPVILISGTFYSTSSLPAFLRDVARVLPLTHVIDGYRGAIATGSGLGNHLTGLAVVAAWAIAGVVLAVRNFRWE